MNLERLGNRLFGVLLTVALLGLASGSAYPAVTIKIQLEKNVLRVGEQTRMQIVVTSEGETISENPVFPDIDGINFVYINQSTSQQFQFINGRASSSYQVTFLYDVFALKEGKFSVNTVSIVSSAGTIKADPFEITVFPGSEPVPTRSPLLSAPQGTGNLNVYLLVDSSKKEIYKGEEIILSYDAIYHQQWKSWFDRAIARNGEYVGFSEEKGALKNFLAETVDMRFRGSPQPVRMLDSRDLFFQKSIRRYILYPLTPGEYSLLPMTAEFALPVQRVTNFPVKPEAVNLKVKPLPEEGKPDIFEGAVGAFTLKAHAEPLEITEGETVTLHVTLEGIGNIKNAPKPKLPDLSKFDQFDPTQKEDVNISESGMRGRIDYSFVLIPHDINANQIGPVRFAYFDPNQEKYLVHETPPISLVIHPSEKGNVRAGSGVAFNRRLITRVGDDFRFIVTAPEGLSTLVLSIHRSAKYILLFLFPILLMGSAGLWKWRHEFLAARPTVAKSIQAPRLARRLLADARKALEQREMEAVYVKLGKAITDFIDHRWNLTCAGMTSVEMKESLLRSGVSEEQIHSVIAILEEFDSARFSGASQNPDRIQEDFTKAEDLLGQLMKIKSAG